MATSGGASCVDPCPNVSDIRRFPQTLGAQLMLDRDARFKLNGRVGAVSRLTGFGEGTEKVAVQLPTPYWPFGTGLPKPESCR